MSLSAVFDSVINLLKFFLFAVKFIVFWNQLCGQLLRISSNNFKISVNINKLLETNWTHKAILVRTVGISTHVTGNVSFRLLVLKIQNKSVSVEFQSRKHLLSSVLPSELFFLTFLVDIKDWNSFVNKFFLSKANFQVLHRVGSIENNFDLWDVGLHFIHDLFALLLLKDKLSLSITSKASSGFNQVWLKRHWKFDGVGEVREEVVVLARRYMVENILSFFKNHAQNLFLLCLLVLDLSLEDGVNKSQKLRGGITHRRQSADSLLDKAKHVLLLGGAALLEERTQ